MKPPFHYWFCRIFVIVVWPLMAVTIIYALYDGAKRDDPRVLLMAFAWIPAILLMVRWGLSLSAFGFDFSAFGRYNPIPNAKRSSRRYLSSIGCDYWQRYASAGHVDRLPLGLGHEALFDWDGILALRRHRSV